MAIAVEVAFHGPTATPEMYYESLKRLGATPGGPHIDPSCMFHWMTETGGGLHVTDVWKTKEAFEAFAAGKLAAVVEELGMAKPEIKFVDVANFQTAGS